MWVNSPAITAADILDGRTVLGGLNVRGSIADNIVLQTGKVDAHAITFRLVPPDGGSGAAIDPADPLTQVLSLIPDDIAELGADLNDAATVISIADGLELDDNTVYHLGTEAIRVGAFPNITRHIWDTHAQAHNVAAWDRTMAVRIYEHPPTLEGRRAALYLYEDDAASLAGAGERKWVGQIARSPYLDTDGVTWVLETLPVTHVLRQTLAGGRAPTRPVGIYHNRYNAVYAQFRWDGVSSSRYFYSGFDPHEDSLVASLNVLLDEVMTDIGAYADGLTSMTVVPTYAGLQLQVICTATLPFFEFQFGSTLLGYYSSDQTPWRNDSGESRDGWFVNALTAGNWFLAARPHEYNPGGYLGAPSFALGVPTFNPVAARFFGLDPSTFWTDPAAVAANINPEWRMYTEYSLESATSLHITGLPSDAGDGLVGAAAAGYPPDDVFSVNGTGTETFGPDTYHYVDLFPQRRYPFRGVVNAGHEVTITALRSYSLYSHVGHFMQDVLAKAIFANDGDTPWVTDIDVTTWDIQTDIRRIYEFAKEVALEDVLIPDLQLCGYIMRIAAGGRIDVVRLPLPTEGVTVAASHVIVVSTIISQQGQIAPMYAPQRDGVLTTVTVWDEYRATKNEWVGVPQIYDNQDAISTHKRRGQAQMQIKPYSRRADGDTDVRSYEDIAKRFLALLGMDYVVITVEVPWFHFPVLCGDIVQLTHPLLPAGDGTRGIVARACVCVGREWNLEPGTRNAQGKLELWMPAVPVYGYAPSALIATQLNTSGTTWNLTFSLADQDNIDWSTNADGKVLQRFSAGDSIRIYRRDDAVSSEVVGTILSVDADAGTATVVLGSAWAPLLLRWIMEYRRDSGGLATANQLRSPYVADNAGVLPSGGRGRRMS